MNIKNIVIAGAGTMGYSMAQIFAKNNYNVIIYDLSEKALENAKKRIHENMNTLVAEHELTQQELETCFQCLSYTADKECFEDCDIVIESIVEDLNIKRNFYREISRIVKDETILATNTSGLSINAISEVVYKPERFIGMHWFNPSHLILLIEIIKGDQTSNEIAKIIYDLSLAMNKKPVIINQDVPGFVANRIQFAVLREVLYLVEKGVVSKEGIDDIMKYGLGFRYACLGPLEIADFGGLDTFHHISEYLMKDLCDSHEVPPLLNECYRQGYLGLKTKKGFYDYSDNRDMKATQQRDEKLLKLFHAMYVLEKDSSL